MINAMVPRVRPERLIAAGRVVLSAFSLFAVWLDPTEPAKYADFTYGLLAAYVGFAIVIAVIVWRTDVPLVRWALATHVIDLALFSLVIFLTSGPGSPFIAYFVFSMMCAAVRWQARGTIATAAFAVAVFAGLGVYFAFNSQPGDFDARAFVIRGVYLAVMSVLLVHIGIHEQRMLREMWLLTSWPEAKDDDIDELTARVLGFVRPLIEAHTVAFSWTRADAEFSRLSVFCDGSYHVENAPHGSLVHPDLEGIAFISNRGAVRAAQVQRQARSLTLEWWRGEPFADALRSRVAGRSALVVPVQGETAAGRLIFIDGRDFSADDVVLAEIVGRLIIGQVDAFFVEEQIHAAAAGNERVRLARDLHDGVLQAFTGVALKLAAVQRMLAMGQTRAATAEIERMQTVIRSEQRELRFYIQDLKPAGPSDDVGLSERLSDLIVRFEREWDLAVTLELAVDDTTMHPWNRDVYHIIRESLVNAARHGVASKATVRIGLAAEHGLRLTIIDDGRGFAFSGTYSSDELSRLGMGPKTLRERVEALNGTLTIRSCDTGAELHIELPLAAA